MIGSSRSYAIGMAHFKIAGGWKALGIVCAVYLALFFTGLALFYYADTAAGTRTTLSAFVVTLLLMFESFVLIVFGSFRIMAAIRIDMTTRMIESHRLMPVPNRRAVLGYMLGGAAQATCFAVLNMVLAFIMAGVTHVSLTEVTLGQVLLFSFAILVWTLSALGTLLFKNMHFVAVAALVFGGCLAVPAYNLLPGMALLISPMIGSSVFSFSVSPGASGVSEWAYPASIGGQAVLVAILFAGACRLYRGTYLTTFTALQAILLLVAWCGISIMGLLMWEHFHFLSGVTRDFDAPYRYTYQTIGSVAVAMILAGVPLRTITTDHPGRRTRAFVSAMYVLACCVVISLISLASSIDGPQAEKANWAASVTALVVGAHVVTVFLMFKWMRNLKSFIAILVIAGTLLLLWIGPLILEMLRTIIAVRGGDETGFGTLGTLSPLGLLMALWIPSSKMPSVIPGLVVQWMIVFILGIVVALWGKKAAVPDAAVRAVAPPGALS